MFFAMGHRKGVLNARTLSRELRKYVRQKICLQVELFKKQAIEVDIIITNAFESGKPAPTLITADMISSMKSGAVTVDLAAESGGNIETTVTGDVFTTANGVSCIGYTNMAGRNGEKASELYSTNLSKFLLSMGPSTGALLPDFEG